MCAGGATTTVYPSTTAEDVGYILADSGSVVAFAEDAAQAAKVDRRRPARPLAVVLFDGDGRRRQGALLDQLADRGRTLLAEEPDAITRIDAARARRTWPR